MITVKVPGTTANIGPGFDSFGMAFDIYNEYQFEIIEGMEAEFIGFEPEFCNISNLVYQGMLKVFNSLGRKLEGVKITALVTDIPISRGLGSSSACIVGGLFGANALLGEPLTRDELFDLAVEIEGHPDNVAPAIYGGLVVSLKTQNENFSLKHQVHEKYNFFILIPDFPLSTELARNALPSTVFHSDAVFNVSRATMTYLSLINGESAILKASCQDKLHQPYREALIRNCDIVFKKVRDLGMLAACISGAGPSILCIGDKKESVFIQRMQKFLSGFEDIWEIKQLYPDIVGVRITKA